MPTPNRIRRPYRAAPCCLAAALAGSWLPLPVHAQAGPPFLTNDPGTPGNGNWEINIGSAQAVTRAGGLYQLPQVDLNFGLGERIQLTYEIPYELALAGGQESRGGWGNAYPGVKWRFYDAGEEGWHLSAFPQLETGVGSIAQQRGFGEPGPRWLVPLEASKSFGPVDVDVEVGHYFPRRGASETIAGLVVGHDYTARLELDAEVYRDHATGGPPDTTLVDLGGRYKLSPAFILLFMGGRSVAGSGPGQLQFNGYVGIQILLGDYGRTLQREPPAH